MKFDRFIRLAQMPEPGGMPPMPGGPPGGPPGAGGPPGGGMPPMPPMPGGPPPGGPPGAPGADPNAPKEKIGSPLETIFQILYDADIMNEIQGAGKSKDEIAADIWKMYGGTETGGIDTAKLGTRNPNTKNVSPEQEEQEEAATENSRWKRLPVGKNIGDITTLDELSNSIQGIMSGLKKPPAPAGPGGPGGPPPGLASFVPNLIRLASLYDENGRTAEADTLDAILRTHSGLY